MFRLIQFLKHKWLVSCIGLLAIVIIIWFGGPYLGIGESKPLSSAMGRLLAILAVVLIWGINNLRQQNQANKSNQHMIEQLVVPSTSDEPEADASAEEVAILRDRFAAVLQKLKQTGIKGLFAKHYLYELPWYIIIGPPGAGKTTLLENSGLEFPLTANDSSRRVQGVGGTRNCDWWFTNRAVLLDTAGRYVTQDSYAEADSGAWLGVLDLLRKNRPRRPLNGILIAVSMEDIMTSSAAEREQHAQAIRQRINELYSRLGMRLPIYYTFTKCDLIAGFNEFFDDFDQTQRQQVWGMTFARQEDENLHEVSRFGLEYDALVKRVNDRVLLRLREERDLGRRGLINNFPQQLASIKPLLDDFLQQIFRANRYEQSLWLRGIYFTSGTQNGSPIDNIMQSLANSFRLSSQGQGSFVGQPRAYFIQKLFDRIIFDESDIAGANRKYERQRVWLQHGAYAAAVILTAVIVVSWSASFTRNEYFLSDLQKRIARFQQYSSTLPRRVDSTQLSTLLEHAQDITNVYGESGSTPWLTGMGLYQGIKLGRSAQRAYGRILNQYLLPYIRYTLESEIQRETRARELSRLLGLYLMLGDPQSMDRSRIKPWIEKHWQEKLKSDVNKQKNLSAHLDNLLLDDIQGQKLDSGIKRRAQRLVCEIPVHRQVYHRLTQVAEDDPNINPYTLRRFGRASRVFSTLSRNLSVAPLYTHDGYHRVFKERGANISRQAIEENQRICKDTSLQADNLDAAPLLKQVEELYYQDYIAAWRNFFTKLRLRSFSSVRDAEETLKVLAGPDSPLMRVVKETSQHTLLNRQTFASIGERFGARYKPADPVEFAYQDLHKLLQAQDKDPPPMEDLLAGLKELHGLVAEIAEGVNPNEAAFQFAQGRLSQGGKDVIRKLRNRSRSLPNPAKQIVASAALQSWGTLLGAAKGHINSAWQNTVLRDFEMGLKNRYPLYKRAARQATLDDFGRFFGYDGSIDQFLTNYLKPFVDTRRWRSKVMDDLGLGLSANALRQLKRATLIKKVFFQQGGQQPSLRFSLRPINLDKRAKRFNLDLNGQTIAYYHGPKVNTKMEWPGPGIGGDVRFSFERLGTGRIPRYTEGTWAWFKLLDRSHVQQRRGRDRVVVIFAADGLKASYQLRASSVQNPFSSDMLSFRCPTHL